MSGIYIPSERLPETLTAMWIFPDGDVAVFGRNEDITRIRKAIPIPDHGRLIDADALEEYLLNDPSCLTIFEAIKKLQGMPTIIPADRQRRARHENQNNRNRS